MSDPVSLASLFDAAEQAAMSGDFAAAARLLGEAARAQEAALGPDHLDLANTLNNLAVAHERSGQLDAAEREYRRAHAIAARTRPADDPLVTTSAQNLREFCEANGRPVDVPPSAMTLADEVPDPATTRVIASAAQADVPTVPIEPLPLTLAAEPLPTAAPPRPAAPEVKAAAPKPTPAAVTPVTMPAPTRPKAASPTPPSPTAIPPARSVSAPEPAAPARRVSIPVLVAAGAIAALVIWLLAGRGPAAPPAETTAAASNAPSAAPSTAPSVEPSAPPAAAPVTPAPTPTARPSAPEPSPAAASADGLTVSDAQLCTSLSSSYRCDEAGSTVRPGRVVFYTRLVAARDTSVVHRWYRGDELRQAIRLSVPARRQGFRTFSRGTVYATEGEWRVELRAAGGQILDTKRFTVR